MTHGVVAAVRCHFCSRQVPPSNAHRLGSTGLAAQTICDYCLDWHNKAIEFLAGGGIPGCQQCGASWEILCAREPGSRISLYVVPKDGVLQVLCRECLRVYVPKRADLYRGTPFGSEVLKL